MARTGRRDAAAEKQLNALDIGRGAAIVSVISGHALTPWALTAGGHFSEAAFVQWKLGASFVMAFFFFLSGLGWRDHRSLSSAARQALSLVLVVLIASAAYDVARLAASVVGLATQLGGQTLTVDAFAFGLERMILVGDYYSLSPLWYVVTLALVRAIAALALRLDRPFAVLLVAGVLAMSAAATAFDWRNFYQIEPLGLAVLFFFAGWFSRQPFRALQTSAAAAYALMLLSGGVLLLTFALNQGCTWDAFARCGNAASAGRFSVLMMHGEVGNIPLFLVTAIAGVAFASSLAIVLARLGGVLAGKLNAWGRMSLGLLIVNALFMHVGNVVIERWVAPSLDANSAVFFVMLLALSLAANLIALRLLQAPLHWMHRTAYGGAQAVFQTLAAVPAALAWAQRSDRVSQRND